MEVVIVQLYRYHYFKQIYRCRQIVYFIQTVDRLVNIGSFINGEVKNFKQNCCCIQVRVNVVYLELNVVITVYLNGYVDYKLLFVSYKGLEVINRIIHIEETAVWSRYFRLHDNRYQIFKTVIVLVHCA